MNWWQITLIAFFVVYASGFAVVWITTSSWYLGLIWPAVLLLMLVGNVQ